MTEEVINALWTQGVLFDLDIGKSQFHKKNKPGDLLLDDVNPDAMTVGGKKLLPSRVISALAKIETQSRLYLESHSVKFPLSGARFVYYKALDGIIKYLEQRRAEWNKTVLEIAANYESLKAEQLQVLDNEALKIAQTKMLNLPEDKMKEWLQEQHTNHVALFPPLEVVQDRFRFGWRMYKVNAIDGLSAMGSIEQSEIAEAQKKLHAEMQAWVKEASAAIHKKLGEAAANASALLKKQGKLNPKNLRPLFEAFEEFKAVDFTGSSDFRTKIDAVVGKFKIVNTDGVIDFATSADAVNSTAAGQEQFKEFLNDLSELAVDAVAEEAGIKSLHKVGEFKRVVEL